MFIRRAHMRNVLGVMALSHCMSASGSDLPVAAMTATLDRFENCELRGAARSTLTSTMLPESANQESIRNPETRDLLFRRSGQKALLSETVKVLGTPPAYLHTDYIFTNGDLLQIQATLDERREQVKSNDELAVLLHSERLAGRPERKDIPSVLAALNDSGLIFGVLGGHSLPAYLSASARITQSAEGAFVRLDSVSSLGHLTVSLDPGYGYLPRKLLLVKAGTDSMGERSVGEIRMAGDGKRWPAGSVRQLTWTAENIALANSSGVPYIKQVRLERKTFSEAGPVVTLTTDAEVTEAQFKPVFGEVAFTTTIAIPNHFDVTIVGAQQLPYEWNGSDVVPSVARVTGSGEAATGFGRPFLIVANVLLVLAIAAYLLFQRLAIKKST